MNRNDQVKTPRLGNINYESTIPSTTTLLVTFNYDLTGGLKKNELTAESYNFSNAIGRLEEILRESAPKEIDEAIEFFQKKLEW